MKAQAMILAAGRGERLRPFTDVVPKPLLFVGRHRLIEWHLLRLARDGVSDVVINVAWLADQFPAVLGDGSRYGVRIHWSFEGGPDGRTLDTGGGIRHALSRLEEQFWVVAADVFVPDFGFDSTEWAAFAKAPHRARLWMVPNPTHHPAGDFAFEDGGELMRSEGCDRWTWGSIGLFKSELFASIVPGERLALRPILDMAIEGQSLAGRRFAGKWFDVGTVARWQIADGVARGHRPDLIDRTGDEDERG